MAIPSEIAQQQRESDQPHRRRPRARPAWRAPGVRWRCSCPSRPERNGRARRRTARGGGGRGPSRTRCSASWALVADGPTSSRAGSPGARRQQEEHQRDDAGHDGDGADHAADKQAHGRQSSGIVSTAPGRSGRERSAARYLSPCPAVSPHASVACVPSFCCCSRRLCRRRRPPWRHGALRLRRRPAEHQPAAHDAPARPTGAALRAAHHAGALRQRARCRGRIWPGVGPGRPTVGRSLPSDSRRRSVARRRRRPPRADVPLDARRGPRPRRGYPRLDRSRGARLGRRHRTTPRSCSASPLRRPPFPTCSPTSRSCRRTCSTRCRAPALRQAAWNEHPVGNGPFRFVRARAQPPLGLRGQSPIPRGARRTAAARPAGDRGGGRTDDQAGRAHGRRARLRRHPAGARRVRADAIPGFAVVDYPLLFTYGIVFNTRRPPFDRLAARTGGRRRRSTDARSSTATSTASARPADRVRCRPSRATVVPAGPQQRACSSVAGASAFELLTVGSGEAALEQMIQAQLARAPASTSPSASSSCRRFSTGSTARPTISTRPSSGIPGDLGLGYLGPLATLGRDDGARAIPPRRTDSSPDSLPVAFPLSCPGSAGDEPPGARGAHGSSRGAGHRQTGGESPDAMAAARATAPVRLDFAGGWTDVPPFSAEEGGAVVSAAIALRAHAEVPPERRRASGSSRRTSAESRSLRRPRRCHGGPGLALSPRPRSACCRPTAGSCCAPDCDAPAGSGLGSSGALDVALVAALAAAGDERPHPRAIADLGLPPRGGRAGIPGGRQDQFAAAFGGFLPAPFPRSATPRVERLHLSLGFAAELERRIVLCYTGASRFSGATIARVMQAYERGDAGRDRRAHAAGGIWRTRWPRRCAAGDLGHRRARCSPRTGGGSRRSTPGMRTAEMARLEPAMRARAPWAARRPAPGRAAACSSWLGIDVAAARGGASPPGARLLPVAGPADGVRYVVTADELADAAGRRSRRHPTCPALLERLARARGAGVWSGGPRFRRPRRCCRSTAASARPMTPARLRSVEPAAPSLSPLRPALTPASGTTRSGRDSSISGWPSAPPTRRDRRCSPGMTRRPRRGPRAAGRLSPIATSSSRIATTCSVRPTSSSRPISSRSGSPTTSPRRSLLREAGLLDDAESDGVSTRSPTKRRISSASSTRASPTARPGTTPRWPPSPSGSRTRSCSAARSRARPGSSGTWSDGFGRGRDVVRGRELPPLRAARPARRPGLGPTRPASISLDEPRLARSARGPRLRRRRSPRSPTSPFRPARTPASASRWPSRCTSSSGRRASPALGAEPRAAGWTWLARALRRARAAGEHVRLLPARGRRSRRPTHGAAQRPLLVDAAGPWRRTLRRCRGLDARRACCSMDPGARDSPRPATATPAWNVARTAAATAIPTGSISRCTPRRPLAARSRYRLVRLAATSSGTARPWRTTRPGSTAPRSSAGATLVRRASTSRAPGSGSRGRFGDRDAARWCRGRLSARRGRARDRPGPSARAALAPGTGRSSLELPRVSGSRHRSSTSS